MPRQPHRQRRYDPLPRLRQQQQGIVPYPEGEAEIGVQGCALLHAEADPWAG